MIGDRAELRQAFTRTAILLTRNTEVFVSSQITTLILPPITLSKSEEVVAVKIPGAIETNSRSISTYADVESTTNPFSSDEASFLPEQAESPVNIFADFIPPPAARSLSTSGEPTHLDQTQFCALIDESRLRWFTSSLTKTSWKLAIPGVVDRRAPALNFRPVTATISQEEMAGLEIVIIMVSKAPAAALRIIAAGTIELRNAPVLLMAMVSGVTTPRRSGGVLAVLNVNTTCGGAGALDMESSRVAAFQLRVR